MALWQRLAASMLVTLAIIGSGCSVGSKDDAPPSDQLESQDLGSAAGGLSDSKSNFHVPPASSLTRQTAKKAEATRERDASVEEESRNEAADEPAPAAAAPGTKVVGGKAKSPAKAETRLYIIRKAALTVQPADSVQKAMDRVSVLVRKFQGFISDSHLQNAEGGTPSANLTIRVPALAFDDLLNELGNIGKVHARTVTGDDVTLEFVDTQSRIRNKQKEEKQLLQLLTRTAKLMDILEVERELSRVRGEIEQSMGRIRQLSNLVDLATIEISLTEKVITKPTTAWDLGPVFENAWLNAQRSLERVIAYTIETTVWFVTYAIPVMVLILIPYIVIGLGLKSLLVRRMKVLTEPMFLRLWLGLALAAIVLTWKDLIPWLLMVAVATAVIAGGSALFNKFFRRNPDLD